MKDTALGEGLMTNIALWLRLVLYLPLDSHLSEPARPPTSERVVYFIQTGGSALSNMNEIL